MTVQWAKFQVDEAGTIRRTEPSADIETSQNEKLSKSYSTLNPDVSDIVPPDETSSSPHETKSTSLMSVTACPYDREMADPAFDTIVELKQHRKSVAIDPLRSIAPPSTAEHK
jgi:hypothetical protein